MTIIYLKKIDDSMECNLYKEVLNKISSERRERIKKYKFERDKVRCLWAEMLLRLGLQNEFGITDDMIRITFNQYGKPYLEGYNNVFFNISHSGEWVVCAFSDKEVGVDVEKVDSFSIDVANRILTNEEYTIFTRNKSLQQDSFFRYWTLKEAYTKARGYGMIMPFNEVQFNNIYNNIHVLYKSEIDKSYIFNSQYIDEQHLLSICIKKASVNSINYKFVNT